MAQFVETFYLAPRGINQKSFGGKAQVAALADDGGMVLRSYRDNVCAFLDGEFVASTHDFKLSATTMRHINAFRAHCGLAKISWREFVELSHADNARDLSHLGWM